MGCSSQRRDNGFRQSWVAGAIAAVVGDLALRFRPASGNSQAGFAVWGGWQTVQRDGSGWLDWADRPVESRNRRCRRRPNDRLARESGQQECECFGGRRKWSGPGLNRRHRPFQGRALPTELPDQMTNRHASNAAEDSKTGDYSDHPIPVSGRFIRTFRILGYDARSRQLVRDHPIVSVGSAQTD